MVDASVIPTTISGNTYTTQVMIAEKIADQIRGKDTVAAIKEYFKFLLAIKHKKLLEDEEESDPVYQHLKHVHEQQEQQQQNQAKQAKQQKVNQKVNQNQKQKPNGKNGQKQQANKKF